MSDEFLDILKSSACLKRMTNVLMDKAPVAASMTPDRQPPKSCRLLVTVEGATIVTGLITVDGTTTEQFAFWADGETVGEKDFTSISAVTVSGISDGFVEIRALTKTGQDINQEKTVYAALPVRFQAISGRIRMMAAGQEKISKYKIMVGPDKDIQENDMVYAISGMPGAPASQVSFVDPIMDFDGMTHHFEAELFSA